MDLTEEQRLIIEETITNKDGIYGIQATAGSGKSFTIFKAIDYIKEKQPNAKILYIVFNKANQLEAEFKLRKYESWLQPVKVCTAHSFAREKYLKVRKKFDVMSTFDKDIIFSHQKSSYIRQIKYSKHRPFKWLLEKYHSSRYLLDAFCEFMEMHFDDDYVGPDKPTSCTIFDKHGNEVSAYGIKVDAYSVVTKNHIEVFKDIFKDHENRGLYTHGMYLKSAAYCKNLPSENFDYVFFDEAQDASYFMLKVLEKQNIKKLYFVGDERQSIYDFDGANVNVFSTQNFDKVYKLSKSFRFGSAIADLANTIIQLDSDITIEGTEQPNDTNITNCTRLYRTNAKLFKDSLELAYFAVTNGTKLKLDFLNSNNDSDDYVQNEILGFLGLFYKYTNIEVYKKAKHIFENIQLSPILTQFSEQLEINRKFYKTYNAFYDMLSDDLHYILYYAKENSNFLEKYAAFIKCKQEAFPDYTINMITMHRSKGLEWDNVVIAEKVKIFFKDKNGVLRKNNDILHELNLAYVAVTRARKSLNAYIFIEDFIKLSSEFYNKSFVIENGKAIKTNVLCNTYEDSRYEIDEELCDEASSAINDYYTVKQ